MFAVKDSLIVDFKPLVGDENAQLQLEYDIYLIPVEEEGKKV